jgi:hypothetical protein
MRLLAAVLGSAVLVALGVGAAGATDGTRTLRFLDVGSQNVPAINGFTFDRMPRPGDQFAIQDNLYKWAGSKRGALVGHVLGIGTFQNASNTGGTVLFVAQAYIPGGSIDVQGYGRVSFRGPSKFTFPITGGTGMFASARGWITVRDIGNGDNSSVVAHVMP